MDFHVNKLPSAQSTAPPPPSNAAPPKSALSRNIRNTTSSQPAKNSPASWTQAKVSREAPEKMSTVTIGNRHLAERQRKITVNSQKLFDLDTQKAVSTEKARQLQKTIKKITVFVENQHTVYSADIIDSFREKLASKEIQLASHQENITNIEKQIKTVTAEQKSLLWNASADELKKMETTLTFSLTNDSVADLPMPKGSLSSNASEIFKNVAHRFGESVSDQAFGTVLKDFFRGANRLHISDNTGNSTNPIFSGSNKETELIAAGSSKDIAMGSILKEELRTIAQLTLSEKDQKAFGALLDGLTGNWSRQEEVEKKIGPAISATLNNIISEPTIFSRLLNQMRTAGRLAVYTGLLKNNPDLPKGYEYNLPNTDELGQFPYKTDLKITPNGFELSHTHELQVRKNHLRIGTCEHTITYSFDKEMNLIELRSKANSPKPLP